MTASVAPDGPGGASALSFYDTGGHHPENGTLLGFWLYLMSDCLVFACLFAVYAVLGRNYKGSKWYKRSYDLIERHVPSAVAAQPTS